MSQSATVRAHIEVAGVGKSYGDPRGKAAATVALESIDLDVARGEFVSIVGPSGCGKSTLLRIVAGLHQPSTGTVHIGGELVTAPPQDVVYLFQQYRQSIFPWRTVEENVRFGAEHGTRRLSRKESRDEALSYLRLVGLEGFAGHHPWQLSGGMQQRVAIARALAAQPHVLLMDEAFSSVDALTRGTLQDLILEIWADLDLTVVFVTHDIEEAIYLSDRVVVLASQPGRVDMTVDIPLPRPRTQIETKADPVYLDLRRSVLGTVLGTNTGARQ